MQSPRIEATVGRDCRGILVPALTESQRRLLDERIDEHEANPDDVEPWEEARANILRKL
jgi:putative addiction module component (TIGR02574 family)